MPFLATLELDLDGTVKDDTETVHSNPTFRAALRLTKRMPILDAPVLLL